MADVMIQPYEPGYTLEVSGAELDTIKRALQTALERAVMAGAAADEHDLAALMNDIDGCQDDD